MIDLNKLADETNTLIRENAAQGDKPLSVEQVGKIIVQVKTYPIDEYQAIGNRECLQWFIGNNPSCLTYVSTDGILWGSQSSEFPPKASSPNLTCLGAATPHRLSQIILAQARDHYENSRQQPVVKPVEKIGGLELFRRFDQFLDTLHGVIENTLAGIPNLESEVHFVDGNVCVKLVVTDYIRLPFETFIEPLSHTVCYGSEMREMAIKCFNQISSGMSKRFATIQEEFQEASSNNDEETEEEEVEVEEVEETEVEPAKEEKAVAKAVVGGKWANEEPSFLQSQFEMLFAKTRLALRAAGLSSYYSFHVVQFHEYKRYFFVRAEGNDVIWDTKLFSIMDKRLFEYGGNYLSGSGMETMTKYLTDYLGRWVKDTSLYNKDITLEDALKWLRMESSGLRVHCTVRKDSPAFQAINVEVTGMVREGMPKSITFQIKRIGDQARLIRGQGIRTLEEKFGLPVMLHRIHQWLHEVDPQFQPMCH